MVGILLIGDRIWAPYFESDFRVRFSFICIATFAASFIHELIYKRKSLGDLLFTLGIFAAMFVIGAWLSFASFDADAALGFLPILVAMIVAWGVDFLVRKRFCKA